MTLYTTLIRPHLAYCPQVWNPHLKRDTNILEGVQRRATKIVPELQNMSYEDRLVELKLYPLVDRRLRGDMIAVFKIVNGLTDCSKDLISVNESAVYSTRSNNMQLHHPNRKIAKHKFRENFFTHRIVLPWNALSNHVISSKSVGEFKGRYDKEVLGAYNTD